MNEAKVKPTWKQLTIRIPEDVHRALKVRTAAEGKNLVWTVETLIRLYLNEKVKI